MRIVLWIGMAVLLLAPADAQMRRRRTDIRPLPGVNEPAAAITGVLKSADKKKITVELQDGNLLDARITRKTQFFSGKDKIKEESIKPGTAVTLDVEHALDGTLNAVALRIQQPAKPPAQ